MPEEKKTSTLIHIRDFFEMDTKTFRTEWAELSVQEKDEMRADMEDLIANGHWTPTFA